MAATERGTILWHDYETSGVDPRSDRPIQFAAIRTDLELNEVGTAIDVRAHLPVDALMSPGAALITGVGPADLAKIDQGELALARVVFEAMTEGGTCAAGFNSFRFDDEVTRFLFWRCLLPVYEREYARGNSRWDLLDPLRAAHALRPEGLEWPRREDGTTGFRLEELAAANGLEHDAHDALGDVRVTLGLARKMRAAQPELWKYCFGMRRKKQVESTLAEVGTGVLVHVGRGHASENACASAVVAVAQHPRQKNRRLFVDLRRDPELLLEGDAADVRARFFTRRGELEDEELRPGIVELGTNQAPVLAPIRVVQDDATWERLRLTPDEVSARADWVEGNRRALKKRLEEIFREPRHRATDRDVRDATGQRDVDVALYDGFPPDEDTDTARYVHARPPAGWKALEHEFVDERFRELLFRLRAREHPELLDDGERRRWLQHCRARLTEPLADGEPSRADACRRDLERWRAERAGDPAAQAMLDAVEADIEARVAAVQG